EDRRMFSVGGPAVLRLDGPARVGTFLARLDPQDPGTVQLADRAGTAWRDVPLRVTPAGAAGGFIVTGRARGASPPPLVSVGGLRGDGLADLVVHSGRPAAGRDDLVGLMLGNEDGTFTPVAPDLAGPGLVGGPAGDGKVPVTPGSRGGIPAALF